MRVEVWGGAGEYGRSCYFVKIKRQKYYLIVVLIDHMRIVIQNRAGSCTVLDAVFLSHIHEDHTMGLPLLAKYGYKKNLDNSLYEGATSRLL